MRFIQMTLAIYMAVSAMTSIDAGLSYLDTLRANIRPPAQPNASAQSSRANRLRPTLSNKGQTDYRGGCTQNYQFDYLMLTLQWGPGFCSTSARKCIRPGKGDFSVHGMWPQLNSGEEMGFCCFDNTFDPRMIKQLIPDMNRLWFSYFTTDNTGFWSHEWLKHGTCARDVKKLEGEQLFFGTTLDIVKSLPVLDTLKGDNILPSDNGKPYPVASMINSLKRIMGGKKVRANCDLEHEQNVPVLTGFGICFDKDLSFIDCPYTSKRCRDQVLFRNTARTYG